LLRHFTIATIGLIGLILVFLLTNQSGAGITPDSVAYISAARNLAEGNGLLTYNGLYLVVQPPLYPILLAIIKTITLTDPMISAGYVNGVLFGLIVYLSGLFLFRILNSFFLTFLGTVSVLISFTLIQSSVMALSELLFILLLLLFLYFFGSYQKKRDQFSLFLFSASAALSCLTRYTGIVIICTGMAGIIFMIGDSRKKKILNSIVFLLITIIPISIWIVRNYFISGTLVGIRAASSYSLVENSEFFISTILHWFTASQSLFAYSLLILSIPMIWIVFGFVSGKSAMKESVNLIGPCFLFLILYAGTIIISSTTTAYDRIGERLLSPIYIPAILISFFIIDKIQLWLTSFSSRKLVALSLVSCIALLMIYPVEKTLAFLTEYFTLHGSGYNSKSWRESETIEYLLQHDLPGNHYSVYSNEPEAVYIFTNVRSKRSPAKKFYNSPQLYNTALNQSNGWQHGENVCLIWFNKNDRSFLFTIKELKIQVNMTQIAHLRDGEIYTFSQNR